MRKKHILLAFIFLGLGFFLKSQDFPVQPTQYLSSESLAQRLNLVEKQIENFGLYLNFRFNLSSSLKEKNYEESHFAVDQLRLDFMGNINKNLSYYFRQRLNSNTGPEIAAIDKLSRWTDFAYISYKFNDQLAVDLGKQAIAAGGMEYNKNGLYVYEYSDMMNNFTAFFTGIGAIYKPLENHRFEFQLLNNPNKVYLNALKYDHPEKGKIEFSENDLKAQKIDFVKTPLIYTFNWSGDLFNKIITTNWAYSFFEDAKDKYRNFVSLGTALYLDSFTLEYDYLFSAEPIDKLGAGTEFLRKINKENISFNKKKIATNVKYNTNVLNFRYRFLPDWAVLLKGTYETAASKDISPENNTFRRAYGYQGGLEYMPMKDENLRIYLMYAGQTKKYSCNTLPSENNSLIAFGLAYKLKLI